MLHEDTGGESEYQVTRGARRRTGTLARVWTITEDKNGNLWFGTDGGGVRKYDGKSFTNFAEEVSEQTPLLDFPSSCINHLSQLIIHEGVCPGWGFEEGQQLGSIVRTDAQRTGKRMPAWQSLRP